MKKKGEIYALKQLLIQSHPDCGALEWVSRSLRVKNWKCTWDAVCGSQVYKLCPVLPGGSKALFITSFCPLPPDTSMHFVLCHFILLNTQHRTLLSSKGLQKFPHLLRWKTSNKEGEVQIHGLKSSLLRLFFPDNIKACERSFARRDA